LLQPEFATERTTIEAPYRAAPPGQARPTVADYERMIAAAHEMQGVMRRMAAQISAETYLNTDAFLKQLISEAQQRIDAIKTK
jgi:hypothetical protein